MRGHTGAMASLGGGGLMSSSTKRKINTKNSTETELVALDECMGRILWTNYFLTEQGYPPKEMIDYQDNKSAILLEKTVNCQAAKEHSTSMLGIILSKADFTAMNYELLTIRMRK